MRKNWKLKAASLMICSLFFQNCSAVSSHYKCYPEGQDKYLLFGHSSHRGDVEINGETYYAHSSRDSFDHNAEYPSLQYILKSNQGVISLTTLQTQATVLNLDKNYNITEGRDSHWIKMGNNQVYKNSVHVGYTVGFHYEFNLNTLILKYNNSLIADFDAFRITPRRHVYRGQKLIKREDNISIPHHSAFLESVREHLKRNRSGSTHQILHCQKVKGVKGQFDLMIDQILLFWNFIRNI